jgi:hypothetical protein
LRPFNAAYFSTPSMSLVHVGRCQPIARFYHNEPVINREKVIRTASPFPDCNTTGFDRSLITTVYSKSSGSRLNVNVFLSTRATCTCNLHRINRKCTETSIRGTLSQSFMGRCRGKFQSKVTHTQQTRPPRP